MGDTVAMFAQGPIGLCATAGARLRGAGFIIAVESDPVRAAMAKPMGADVVVDHIRTDAVEEIRRMTGGKGVDVAIEALGTQATFPRAMDQFAAERNAQELCIRFKRSLRYTRPRISRRAKARQNAACPPSKCRTQK